MKKQTILVLGATGMLGRTVYAYFKHKYQNTFGTGRVQTNELSLLRVEKVHQDFLRINKRQKKIDFVINCIGEVLEKNPQTLIKTNSLFPHALSELSGTYGFRLIHISSDSVYPLSPKKLDETSPISPQSIYAASKFLGEVTSQNSINIRTSIIGLDPNEKKGLLEYANNAQAIEGFYNYIWTGSTTLQLARLCEYLLQLDKFLTIRNKTNIINFSPLGPLSKNLILKHYLHEIKSKKPIRRKHTQKIKRHLVTKYFDLLHMSAYTTDIKIAIKELIEFEKNYVKE